MAHLTNSELVDLYTSFKDDARGWLALHRQHFTQFVAIILGVLGVSVTAFITLINREHVILIVVIGPTLSILLSFFAISVCSKANSHGKCNTRIGKTSRAESGSLELYEDFRLRSARDVVHPSYHGRTKCHL